MHFILSFFSHKNYPSRLFSCNSSGYIVSVYTDSRCESLDDKIRVTFLQMLLAIPSYVFRSSRIENIGPYQNGPETALGKDYAAKYSVTSKETER